MTKTTTQTAGPAPKHPPENFELRARPAPVTRINRKLLFGMAALVLLTIAGVVLIALRPPTFESHAPDELYSVDRKPISDGLSRLPSSYEEVPRIAVPAPLPAPKMPADFSPTGGAIAPEEQAELAQLARLAAEARAAPVLFRLQQRDVTSTKSARPHGSSSTIALDDEVSATPQSPYSTIFPFPKQADNPISSLRTFAALRPSSEVGTTNGHALQGPASPYQLMAGTIIAESLLTGLNSDLARFRHRPGDREYLRQRLRAVSADPARLAPDRPLRQHIAFGNNEPSSSDNASSCPTAPPSSSTIYRQRIPPALPVCRTKSMPTLSNS